MRVSHSVVLCTAVLTHSALVAAAPQATAAPTPSPGPTPSASPSPTPAPTPAPLPAECKALIANKPTGQESACLKDADVCVAQLRTCLAALKTHVQADRPAGQDLLQFHREYQALKKWRKAIQTHLTSSPAKVAPLELSAIKQLQPTDLETLREMERNLSTLIHGKMRAEGQFEPFFGALITGPVVQTEGKKPDGSDAKTTVTAAVAFESRHLGNDGNKRLHLSVGGRVGWEPVFVMTAPKEGTTGPPTPNHLNGFVWDVGPNVLINGKVLEVGLSGRYGQTRPGVAEVVGETDPVSVAVLSDTSKGLARGYFEGRLRVVVFRGDDGEAAHERAYLLPAATADFGLRHDQRFKDDPLLRDFNSPAARFFFGFRLNALRIFNAGAEPGRYELTFGIEHEWARRSDGLPSATRVVLAGSANLLKAFGGAQPKPAAPASPGATPTPTPTPSPSTTNSPGPQPPP